MFFGWDNCVKSMACNSSHNQLIFLGSTMAEVFIRLERISIISAKIADKMKRSVGFRNVAVHNDDIDLSITYDIANKHLNDFKGFIRQILEYNSNY